MFRFSALLLTGLDLSVLLQLTIVAHKPSDQVNIRLQRILYEQNNFELAIHHFLLILHHISGQEVFLSKFVHFPFIDVFLQVFEPNLQALDGLFSRFLGLFFQVVDHGVKYIKVIIVQDCQAFAAVGAELAPAFFDFIYNLFLAEDFDVELVVHVELIVVCWLVTEDFFSLRNFKVGNVVVRRHALVELGTVGTVTGTGVYLRIII